MYYMYTTETLPKSFLSSMLRRKAVAAHSNSAWFIFTFDTNMQVWFPEIVHNTQEHTGHYTQTQSTVGRERNNTNRSAAIGMEDWRTP